MAIVVGILIIAGGTAFLRYAIKMSPDDHINMGLGSQMGRLDACFRAGMVLFMGVMVLVVGLLVNV